MRALPIAALLAASVLVSPAASAQTDPATARAERAIADHERCKEQWPGSAQERRTLQWLGEVDHPLVTDHLRREFAATKLDAAAPVLEAIGMLPRPDLQPLLVEALQAPAAPPDVRSAAATALARSGDRGVDALLDVVRAADGGARRVRAAALGALVEHGGGRGHRGLAPLLGQGPMAQRLELLRAMDGVRGVAPVSNARIQLVRDGDLETAAVAWRQLAAEGHVRARGLAIDVLERVLEQPPPAVAAELVRGVVLVHDPDLYPVLLRFGAVPGEVVRSALRAAAADVARDRGLVSWLLQKGLASDQASARDVALLLLREAPADAIAPLLERVRADLRAGGRQSLDRAVALHPLLAKDPGWQTDLRSLAESRRPEVRVVGLALLLDIGSDVAIPAAQKYLAHRDWTLRSISYRYLTRCRDVSSIPLLIDRAGREDGRLALELSNALFVHTGTRCFSRREWQKWWEQNQVGFALPPIEAVRGGVDAGAGRTTAYHGIPVVSRRIAFLVDVSGSMRERLATDRNRTRLDGAREQLVQVFTELPEGHRCNLIAYDSTVQPLWSRMRAVDADNRKKLLDATAKLALGAATNIFDALETAFADPEVDTIYLLTDGQPNTGRLTVPEDIVDEVLRWNLERQIVVHCIGLGVDPWLLRELASRTGGEYRHVD